MGDALRQAIENRCPDVLATAAEITEPGQTTTEQPGEIQVVELETLVRIKRTSYRDKDPIHLRDMIDVQPIDETWPAKFSGELAQRLQVLLADPGG